MICAAYLRRAGYCFFTLHPSWSLNAVLWYALS
ncbi:hypothetical protein T05_7193 [Trichinella murrelli]|uniref:Uncharacterized protein n=1 Tax=Trichinella murrelli TaxID=144512 RepID=A0A0V0SYK5_9BILA|nr:hypothetical protein T05_7193 [Trichinella murrelli]